MSGYEIVSTETSPAGTQVQTVMTRCPSGKLALGGGAIVFGIINNSRPSLKNSSPLDDPSGWQEQARQVLSSGDTWQLKVYAICANVG